jgi:hypothetical protein
MGDLKPLGSEKLKADEKLKRILELTYYNDKNKKSTNNTELVKESTNGGVYGIVKERDGYYVKMGLNEQSLDYIGGLFMKNKNRFSSYAEALKRLELIKGQDELQEATKYVLKQTPSSTDAPPPAAEAPLPSPEMDAMGTDSPDMGMGSEVSEPPIEGGEMGAESMPAPEEPSSDVPSEEGGSKKSDYMAEVQKYAGKLGQELRDMQDKMESDDIKYVLNMIISAVDLDKLDLDDIEEIGDKFKRDEESSEMGDEELPEPEVEEPVDDTEVPSEEPSPESDLGEYEDPMSKLEEFIDTPIGQNNEIDLADYVDVNEDDMVELDMNEIQRAINQSVGETLSKYFKH